MYIHIFTIYMCEGSYTSSATADVPEAVSSLLNLLLEKILVSFVFLCRTPPVKRRNYRLTNACLQKDISKSRLYEAFTIES